MAEILLKLKRHMFRNFTPSWGFLKVQFCYTGTLHTYLNNCQFQNLIRRTSLLLRDRSVYKLELYLHYTMVAIFS